MKRHDLPHCALVVPDDWVPAPPFTLAGQGGRLTLRVAEQRLEKPVMAAAHAARQRELLSAIHEDFELLHEGEHPLDGLGHGYFQVFSHRNDQDEEVLSKAIYVLFGPLVCTLVLSGPTGADRDRDRIFEAIGRSFSLQRVDYLARAQQVSLFSEAMRKPPLPSAQGRPALSYPLSCVSLPCPIGWESTTEEGDAVFRRQGAEIRLRRLIGDSGNVDDWYSQQLGHIRESGGLLLASQRGEIAGRGPFAAILHDEQALVRTWNTPSNRQLLSLFLREQHSFLWVLRSPGSSLQEGRLVLEDLITEARILPPQEWETHLAEPWMDATLQGPWRSEGPGIYVCLSEGPLLLQLSRGSSRLAHDKLRPSVVTPLVAGLGLWKERSRSEADGAWQGHQALRIKVEGITRDRQPISLCAAWFSRDQLLYNVLVRGAETQTIEPLFLHLLERLRLPPS